jgi:hypothetical protein
MRTHREAEERLVGAALQLVAPGCLVVGPACGQVVDAGNVVVDDGVVAHGGSDHAVRACGEGLDERRQALRVEHGRRAMCER